MASVARHMPNFAYNPALGSFKGWLLNMTRWRITDQLRRRVPMAEFSWHANESTAGSETNPVEQMPDPASSNLETLSKTQWEDNLLRAAIAKVKRHVDPEK